MIRATTGCRRVPRDRTGAFPQATGHYRAETSARAYPCSLRPFDANAPLCNSDFFHVGVTRDRREWCLAIKDRSSHGTGWFPPRRFSPPRSSVRRSHAPGRRKLRRFCPTIARARSRQYLARRLLLARRHPVVGGGTGPYAGMSADAQHSRDAAGGSEGLTWSPRCFASS